MMSQFKYLLGYIAVRRIISSLHNLASLDCIWLVSAPGQAIRFVFSAIVNLWKPYWKDKLIVVIPDVVEFVCLYVVISFHFG
jgi:hypothetical protein